MTKPNLSLQSADNLRYEKIPVVVFKESIEASKEIAHAIAASIKEKQDVNKECVLGLATGSSPIKIYAELVRLHKEEGLSFHNVVSFNLDEYYPMQADALQSYDFFMKQHLFDHVDIKDENIHIPDGSIALEDVNAYCNRYEQKIENLGGLDIQILGIGRTGHIGFNEPGSGINGKTRMVTLDHLTKQDAASDFFGEEHVPRKAITMGVGTIMKAKKIYLMAWGESKAPIIQKTVEGPLSEQVPATFLQSHPNTVFYIDEAAAAKLTRFATPWEVVECRWTKTLIKKAVIHLSLKTQKPILKLTENDYIENSLAELIHLKGPAYDININVFNQMQHTITGWPGGKPNADDSNRPERAHPAKKRIIVFSPHPDDDVISMGGTVIRLSDQGHDIHIAYQTSGNIAVFDEDVIDYAEFVCAYHDAFSMEQSKSELMFNQILSQLKSKAPGEIDSPEVRNIKGMIRRVEARSACRYIGIPDSNIHHLDLPFYETGLIKKKPIGPDDIAIVRKLIEDVKPHIIYAAGDLSDPHGTHRVCLDAIFKALKEVKHHDWANDCWLWLYRGAWQEWGLDEIEKAIPLSPDELLRKRRAIFKHQSQKDRPLFPGVDSREFWQRAEQRNKYTAQQYDQLGLAEYEAMEAFKRFEF